MQSLRPRRDGVLLRSDLGRFGSPTQVSAALQALQQKGLIEKVKRGVYAKPDKLAELGEEVLLAQALERLKLLRERKKRTRVGLTPTARRVQLLARRTGVRFTPTYADRWAGAVTRMAGDDVRSDPTDDLLVALRRAGKVSPAEMVSLVMAHHRERRRV